MAARKHLRSLFDAMLDGRVRAPQKTGALPEQAAKDMPFLDREYTQPGVWVGEHGIDSRSRKDGWSTDRVADSYTELLDSKETRGIPNYPGNERSKEALWLPKMENAPMSIFSPASPTRTGDVYLRTIMEQDPAKVLRHLEKESLNKTRPAEERAYLSMLVDRYRNILPSAAMAGMGAGAALSPGEAQADTGASGLMDYIGEETKDAVLPGRGDSRKPIHDPPLETPLFDLADLVTAPIGVAGAAGKALSVAATPFLSAAQEYIMEKAPGLWEFLGEQDQAYEAYDMD